MSVTIERLGHHGDGIAEGPVFAPLTLPGEIIGGDIIDGRIAAPKILTPSSDRVSPPCPHFKSCGGCSLQHASDSFVAAWKISVVETAIAAHGLAAPIRRILTSPPNSRRRATLAGRRTKKGALVGFHGRASSVLTEVPSCRVLHPDILALLPAFKELTMLGTTRKAEIAISVTASDSGVDIAVTGGKPIDLPLRQQLSAMMANHKIARLAWEGETIAQQWPPVQMVQGISVTPPPGAFFQATKAGETALVTAVTEVVGTSKSVIDLFAGCGTFALPLARNAEVHAVESVVDMLGALEAGWRLAKGLKKVSTETRDLYRRPMLHSELSRYDAIVIDPPRAGAEAQTAEIAQSDVARIASVSCNPVTFSRDAKMLVDAGFRLDWIDVIDQFRWSPHVELAAQFSKT